MEWYWVVLVVLCWALIPAAFAMKAVLDRRTAQAQRELDDAIAAWLRDMSKW